MENSISKIVPIYMEIGPGEWVCGYKKGSGTQKNGTVIPEKMGML